jgi:hypothetical protein
MEFMEEFLAADIERITGVKRNRLQQWIEYGFITPSIQEASGSGSRNVWSRADLYSIAIFKKVTESGLSRDIVSDLLTIGVFGDLSDEQIGRISYLVYMRGGERTAACGVEFERGEEPLLDLVSIQKSQGLKFFDDCYILNFPQLKREVDEKINKAK